MVFVSFTLLPTSIVLYSLQAWLPLDYDFLKHCKFVYFESRSEVYFDDVQDVAQEFTITPNNNLVDLENFDELEE